MAEPILTQAFVRECFDYDPQSGILTWRVRPREHFKNAHGCNIWNAQHPGNPAGYIGNNGYPLVGLSAHGCGRHTAHRIIWLYVHGRLPEEIDHINHDRADNRLSNLREVGRLENARNHKMHSHNTSGVTGIRWAERNRKWQATISHKNKTVQLGYFDTLLDAACARKSAERRLGFHPGHGR